MIKEHMLYHLISLMEDAHGSWDVVRACHAILVCRMELGEVKSYLETEKLKSIRRANAQRHVSTSLTDAKSSQKKIKNF